MGHCKAYSVRPQSWELNTAHGVPAPNGQASEGSCTACCGYCGRTGTNENVYLS